MGPEPMHGQMIAIPMTANITGLCLQIRDKYLNKRKVSQEMVGFEFISNIIFISLAMKRADINPERKKNDSAARVPFIKN